MKRTPAKPSKFWRVAPPTDLFLQDQRAAKLDGFVSQLAAIDGWVDFGAIAAKIETVCPAPDRSRGGRLPYATEVMVRLLFLQALYGLSDETCEYQMLDRRSFQCFCGLEDELHLPDARTLWRFKQRLATGGLGGTAIFEAVSQQLQRHGFIPRGGQIIDASIVQAPTTQTRRREPRGASHSESTTHTNEPPKVRQRESRSAQNTRTS